MLPLVSVIIPTYNRSNPLKLAIESVYAQDYPNFELIIIDDGSDDDTARMVRDFSLTYRYQPQQGVSSARNHGIRLSQGQYICFLDSDDLWQRKKLSTQVEFMRAHPDIPVCYTDEIWIRNGVRVNPHKKHGKHSGWIFEHCLPLCIISPSSVMLQRGVLIKSGGFDESLPACEDYDLWLRLSKDYPIEFIPKSLIIKTGGHADQLSHKYWGNDRFRIMSLEKLLLANELTPQQRESARQSLLDRCRILAQGSFKRGKLLEGQEYLEKIERWSAKQPKLV